VQFLGRASLPDLAISVMTQRAAFLAAWGSSLRRRGEPLLLDSPGQPEEGMERGKSRLLAGMAALMVFPLIAQQQPTARQAWNEPQQQFKVFGNTWWVGPHGVGSVLITSPQGHVLIDGGLPESVPQIVASIKAAGFDIQDVKLIVNSHAHYDHAGGIAELQKLSGARLVASEWSAKVLREGATAADDPQYGQLDPMAKVRVDAIVRDGEQQKVGPLAITAHLTPGHTPGGTSWSWRSCEGSRCVDLVYADSLNAAAARGFSFTKSGQAKSFDASFATLAALPCDILLAAHPAQTDLFERLAARDAGKADALIDNTACKRYVEAARKVFAARIATEGR
jgi:metallo-beta-lactamase class B